MSAELVEIDKNAACQAFLDKLQAYTKNTRDIQEKFALSYKDTMNTKLIDNPKLSVEEGNQIRELRHSLSRIIDEVSTRIIHRMGSYDDYVKQCSIAAYDRLRVQQYVDTVKKINTSIQKIKFILEVFSRCNQHILQEISKSLDSGDIHSGKMYVLGNMILILGLADYVISYLEFFKLEGVEEILEIYSKEIDKININIKDLEKLRTNAESPDIEPEVKSQILANIEDRRQSLNFFREEWDNYANMIKTLQTNVGSIKDKIPTLRLIRDNAQNQLDFYEIMKFFGIMMVADVIRKNIATIDIVALPLADLGLISLPPQKVKQLICFTKVSVPTGPSLPSEQNAN